MAALSLRSVSVKNPEWTIHILIWSFFIGEKWVNHYPQADNFLLFGFYHTVFLVTTFILPMYLNAFLLIPFFLKKKRWMTYVLLLMGMILIVNASRGLWTLLYFQWSGMEYNFSEEFSKWAWRDYASLEKFVFSPTALILGFSFGYRLVKDWITHEKIQAELKSEKTSMELAFLKAQVDPHFLFNTLNNLYALSLEEKAQRTSDAITKMGALMRYNLHDAQADKILLSNELNYLEQYIELQKLRIVQGSRVNIRTHIACDTIGHERIAPMILQPFIENAFKHGISAVEDTVIEVELKLKNSLLTLLVKNSVRANLNTNDQSGIGLKNVKHRLQLLYPGRHKLTMVGNDNTCSVTLELDLSV